MIPEDNPPEFVAKHLSPYEFALPYVRGKRVLEIGFGDGFGMKHLSGAAREVVGIDIAPDNIPLARAKYPQENLKFIRFDGIHFPFEDASFEAVISCQVIEHIPVANLLSWLREIARVLSPEGIFIVSTLNLERAMKPDNPYEKSRDHEMEFTPRDLENLLKKVFPRCALYGLHYRLHHRLFRRFKKWGLGRRLPGPINFVKAHFDRVSVADFKITGRNLHKAVDLIAVGRA